MSEINVRSLVRVNCDGVYLLDSFANQNLRSLAKTGTKQNNWRERIARKEDATSPYTVEWGNAYSPFCEARYVFKTSPSHYCVTTSEKTLLPSGYFDLEVDDALKDQALGWLKRRLASQIGESHVFEDLVQVKELSRIYNSINDLSSTLMSTLINIKGKHGLRRGLRHASKSWLSFNFGVQPLLSDFRAVATAVLDQMMDQNHSVRIYGAASKDWITYQKMTTVGTTSAYGHYLSMYGDSTTENHLSYRYLTAIDLLIDKYSSYGVVDRLGLTYEDLPKLAWDLVPYSWAVDYFTTASDFLNDLARVPPGNVKYVVLNTRMLRKTISRNWHEADDTAWVKHSHHPIDGYCHYGIFKREKLQTIPHAGLRFKTLDEIGLFGTSKILNLSAILLK